VVADDLDVEEAAQVELLGPEHGHLGLCPLVVLTSWGRIARRR
jgi:hypothetical protein